MKFRISTLLLSLFASLISISVNAAPNIVASIKPVHSLVAAIMEGAGEPALLIDGNASPHGYQLKPSQAALLQNAQIVFWVGPSLEVSLAKSIEVLAANATRIELLETAEMSQIRFDMHGDGASSGHDHTGHDHEGVDPHFWLNPDNASLAAENIAETLLAADPENATTYKANADKLIAKIEKLNAALETELAAVADKHFLTFHDGYRHFTTRYKLAFAGAIELNPEITPSAGRVREIENLISSEEITCVFSEPQFNRKIIDVILENSPAKQGELDPLGATIENGPDLYFTLMRNIANNLKACLLE